MNKLTVSLLGLLALWACYSPPAVQAACEVQTGTVTYNDGQFIGGDLCDANGNKKVSLGGAGGGSVAIDQTTPGTTNGVVVNDIKVLLSGEDQTNNLLMTSGGAVRQTSLGAVTSATTSAVGTAFVGPKTFMGQIINATSETKAVTALIYGNWTSSTTGGILLCTLTLPSTATTVQLQDACPVITANFSFYYYTTSVYTSTSAAPFTIYVMQ